MNKHFVKVLLGGTLLVGCIIVGWACRPQPHGSQPDAGGPDAELTGSDLFENVASSAGVDATYRNGEEDAPKNLTILESLGGGVAVFDFDGDGLLDIFIPGGGTFEGPDKKQIKGLPCKLYKNLGNWMFKDVTHEVGLDSLAGGQPWFYTHGAAAGDYDCDGWPDLLVTGWGRVALFHNVPDGKGGRRFVDVSAETGLDKGIIWATSAAWGDLDGDGFPDLYVCQYVDWSWQKNPTFMYDGKTPDVAPPKMFFGLPHKLFLNQSDGKGGRRFKDVSVEAGLRQGGENASKGLGVLLVDINGDGKPDIYVANDTVGKFLYVNHSTPGRLLFKEEGLMSGAARDGNGNMNGSMGVDAGDPKCVLRPWLWVTNYENELHGLYRNECTRDRPFFIFSTPAAGIAAIGQKFVGWGTGFVDIDHHGWEDLIIVNGHAIRFPTGAERREKPVLLRNRNGEFKDITPRGGPYFREPHLARGLALGDLDNDGKVDLVISHINEPVAVLRNMAPDDQHWLGISLEGKNHSDVVGACVILEAAGRKQARFAKGGCSYASTPDRRFVFGLASADRVDKVTVTWPNGDKHEWKDLEVDRYHTLIQDEKEAREPKTKK